MRVNALPPSPPEGLIGGHVLAYRRNPLQFVANNAREYGDVVYFRVFNYHVYQVFHPDDVREVLVRQTDHIHKSPIYKRVLGRYLGNGLLISDGEFWKRQRKLMQPAFHAQRINSYAEIMTDYAQMMLDDWRDGQTRELDEDMMRLTLFIVAKALFDADVRDDATSVGDALEVLLHNVIDATRRVINLPQWIDTPNRRRERQAIATLHRTMTHIIDQRRASGEDRGDLLSMLLLAQDDEGAGMTDEQIRNEALTLFLAGHETTANALTWTFYLLSQHPDWEARLHEELDKVLGGRLPTLADLPQLELTERIFKEALRLYPPAHSIGRQAVEEVQLRDYVVPPRTAMLISPYVIHRDPRWYPNPERFDPDRFLPEREQQIPKQAYLPFGNGPRVCIGNGFAMMEGQLLLASIAQKYQLRLDPSQKVETEPLVTLRPKYGMRMRLHQREAVPAPVGD